MVISHGITQRIIRENIVCLLKLSLRRFIPLLMLFLLTVTQTREQLFTEVSLQPIMVKERSFSQQRQGDMTSTQM